MPITDQEMRRKVACHEAGHAVMAYLRAVEVERIVLDFENKEVRGYVAMSSIDSLLCHPDGRQRGKAVVRKYLYTDLLINLAGIRAEPLVLGWTNGGGFGQDSERAWERVRQLKVGVDAVAQSNYMDWAAKETTRILRMHVSTLEVITDRLLQKSVIDADEFLAIMERSNQ